MTTRKVEASVEISPYERAAFELDVAHALAHDMAAFADLCWHTGQRFYALVNASQCGDIEEGRQSDHVIAPWVERHQLQAEQLFRHTPEAALAASGPWLIELPSSAPELFHEVARIAGVAHAMSLLASPLSLTRLAGHLRSWLDGLILSEPAIPDDEATGAVVRWFDPRIGFDMVALWSEDLQHDFLRAFTWAGWDDCFQPRGLRCSTSRSADSAIRSAPMPLDRETLLALTQLNPAEDLLAQVLDEAGPGAFELIAPALQRWVARDQWDVARQLKIADRDSQAAMLHHALSVHPGLSRLPGLEERLSEERQSGGSLVHVFAAQSETWWEEHRQAAPRAWSKLAHHFLGPLRERREVVGIAHPFAALLPIPSHSGGPSSASSSPTSPS
jgi:hypothetical protein